jgi:glutamine---fructose-6-phosphate transaminase (isomerizing)
MAEPGAHSLAEILSQHQSWHDALAGVAAQKEMAGTLLRRYADEPLLVVACGSPYFLGRSAVPLLLRWLGRRATAVPASELLLSPETVLRSQDRPLLITLSRSGETSETIGAARMAQARGGGVLAIGCDRETTLMRMADCAIEIPAGREQSLAQTRSFAGMFVAVLALAATLSDQDDADALQAELHRLPGLSEAYVARALSEVGQLATDPAIERVIYLGSGERYGLACEASLKMKEMSLTNAEAFHVLEFRHGPMALADELSLVVGMIDDRNADEECAVLREAHACGARTLALLEHAPDDQTGLGAVFAFNSGLSALARDVLYLPPAQLLAYERAMAKGVDPDRSRHLSAFVHRPSLTTPGGS